jgi:hypothetical protein
MNRRIIIGNTLVAEGLLTAGFCCDVSKCHGACCVEGDAGAPLEQEEIVQIETDLGIIWEFMSEEGRAAIEGSGVFEADMFNCLVTPLIKGNECAFTVFKDGLALCAIELAWEAGRITFRKPVSCHLYPVRVGRSSNLVTVDVHRWHVCEDAWKSANKMRVPLYIFLKDALIRKFGNEWYEQLLMAAKLKGV